MTRLQKQIYKQKKKEVKEQRRSFDQQLLKAAAFSIGSEFRSLEVAFQQSKTIPLLVHICGTLFPEEGVLEGMLPLRVARDLVSLGLDCGAVVAADESFLGADSSWPGLVRRHTNLPVIYQDMFIDPIQVYQAKAVGADAILIDERFTRGNDIFKLSDAAQEMGIEVMLAVEQLAMPSSIEESHLNGIIVPIDSDAFRDNQRMKEIYAFLSSLPETWIRLIHCDPDGPEMIDLAGKVGFDGILLNSELWKSLNYAERFQEIRQWCQQGSAAS